MNVVADHPMIARTIPTRDRVVEVLRGSGTVLKPFYPHLIAVAVVCGLGLLVAINTIVAPLPANLTQDRWGLIQWQPYQAGPLRDEVMNMRLWGETPGAKVEAVAPAAAAPQWRFIGTTTTGSRRVAVIDVDGTRIQRLGAGEVLPSGARIESVGVGELTLADEGTSRTIKLFDQAKPVDVKPKVDVKSNAK